MATPHLVSRSASSNEWQVLVHVTGKGAGLLTGLSVSGGTSYHHVKVTLDGRELDGRQLAVPRQPQPGDDALAGASGRQDSNNGIALNHRFESELLVQIRDGGRKISTVTRFWASFVMDHSIEWGEHVQEEESVGRESPLLYQTVNYQGVDGADYQIRTLVGPRRTARIVVPEDVLRVRRRTLGRVRLAGSVILRDELTQENLMVPEVPLVLRLHGRATPLKITSVGEIHGELNFAKHFYVVRSGDYELATDIEGFANIPADFTIW